MCLGADMVDPPTGRNEDLWCFLPGKTTDAPDQRDIVRQAERSSQGWLERTGRREVDAVADRDYLCLAGQAVLQGKLPLALRHGDDAFRAVAEQPFNRDRPTVPAQA